MTVFSSLRIGLISGFLAYAMWGIFPLFFHLLREIPATEVLLHRVVWSFVLVSLILLLLGRLSRIRQSLSQAGVLQGLALSSALVSVNWLIYIWSVAQGRVIESSLGYFLTPLISVFLARVILKEQLTAARKLAIWLAVAGLLWLVIRLGYLPWISIALAVSFGLYGLVRKQIAVDSLTALVIETALMLPFALLYWMYLAQNNLASFDLSFNNISLLLMMSGVVTALPLLLFASAAKRLSLSALGFMMYINPTLQFLIAVFVLQESFDVNQLVGFLFIWMALFVFGKDSVKRQSPS